MVSEHAYRQYLSLCLADLNMSGGQCLVTAVSVYYRRPTAAWCKELHSLGCCAPCWLMESTLRLGSSGASSALESVTLNSLRGLALSSVWRCAPPRRVSTCSVAAPLVHNFTTLYFTYDGFVLTKRPVCNSAVHCISACCRAALISCPTGSNKACL